MENQASGEHKYPPNNRPPFKKKRSKRKHPQHPADIVFTKGYSLQTMPSLSKVLKGVTGSIGLQYVWEYRSPSKSVQPHYQCKLCSLSCVQHDIIEHVKGWKHCFKYMKKTHPDKITFEEEAIAKDPSLKGLLKAAAAEVEQTEGRGQIKVILKEPCDVPAFRGFRSAAPRVGPPPPLGMRPMAPPFGPRFHDSGFQEDFLPHGGPFPDYSEEYTEPGFGGFLSREVFPDSGMDRGSYSDEMGHGPPGGGNGFGDSGRSDYGRNEINEDPENMYERNQLEDNFMDRPANDPSDTGNVTGSASESSSLPNTLLKYLDTFRIENESDAQLVLKVTQKLTDVLMEYRLRSISKGVNLNSSSMSSDDQFSSSLSGPSRYGDGPRYYK